jgi:hypothetical protein
VGGLPWLNPAEFCGAKPLGRNKKINIKIYKNNKSNNFLFFLFFFWSRSSARPLALRRKTKKILKNKFYFIFLFLFLFLFSFGRR